jgi:hypothetical protein
MLWRNVSATRGLQRIEAIAADLTTIIKGSVPEFPEFPRIETLP